MNLFKKIILKLFIALVFTAPTFANGQTAEELYNGGVEYANDKNYEAAIIYYDSAIKADPVYADAYYNRATSKLNLKDYKGAIADFDKTIQLKPGLLKAYTNRAIAKVKITDYQGAILDFDKAVQIDPEDASAYFMCGQVKLQVGDVKGGCYSLSRATDMGDTRAQKIFKERCNDIAYAKTEDVPNESLKLDWPKAEGWQVVSTQSDKERKITELVKNGETLENWAEIGTMMVYPSLHNVTVGVAMNVMYEQAKKTCPSAILTFIEKDEKVKYPWIIFKIECSADSAGESQVWQITCGAKAMYVNFWGIKEKKVEDDLGGKWVTFFKSAQVVQD